MHEYSSPSPGKTAPRLIEDLLDYDPKYSKKREFHLLADPAPKFIDPHKLNPIRKGERDCRHELMLKDSQSSNTLPADDQTFDLSTRHVVATYCSKCRYHFHITVGYQKGGTSCALGSNTPLHHFRHVKNKSLQVPPEATSKYDGHTELHHFKCSNTKCPLYTEIKITPPRFGNKFLKLFPDPVKLEARYRVAVRSAIELGKPERFDKEPRPTPGTVLWLLYRYLRDALAQKPDDYKRIARKNRSFMVAYGDDCDELLKHFDFTRSEDLEDGECTYYWNLPRVTPQGNEDQIHFLEDVMFELGQLIEDRRETDLPQGFKHSVPSPALKSIQKCWGCWEYPRKSRQIDLASVEHPHYASLGACEDFTDDLISYCYIKQKSCDRPNRPYYLDCLLGIASGRNSVELQTEVAKEESSGELSLKTIRAAYAFFNLDPDTTEGDSHITGVYRSRIESAPRQKDEARNHLRTIAKSRDSLELEKVADDKSMSPEEAYEFLGVNSETDSGSIEAMAVAKSYDGEAHQAVKALRVIANHRGDTGLHISATDLEPTDADKMDISQAYQTLQVIDTTMLDPNIFIYYTSLMDKAIGQGSKDSIEKALKTIAMERKSTFLLAKLDNPDAIVEAPASTSEHPVGLQNIGNTCYLNSLLQFYYTVKPVRDITMNFEEYRMKIDSASMNKRVQGQVVSRVEIIKAQQFVEELGELYSNLKTASTADVKPSQRLAELALLSTAQENSFRRSSISSPLATFDKTTLLKSPVHAARPSLSTDVNKETPQTPSRPSPCAPAAGDVDVEMTDPPPAYSAIDQDDTSSEATLVNSDPIQIPNVNRDIDSPMRDVSDATEGNDITDATLVPKESTLGDIEILQGVDPFAVEVSEGIDPKVLEGIDPFATEVIEDPFGTDDFEMNGLLTPPAESEKPPPIPPRNKPEAINTNSANDKSMGAEMLKFGAQQDVTEVIQNVMFRLSCAIKPLSLDTNNRNEQIDQIRNTFFGQSTVFLKKPEGWVSSQEDWNNLTVFPATSDTRSIYEALDVYFDPQSVEYENQRLTQYASVRKLPPILQILIQRTAYDKTTNQASKNQNWIGMDESIYLDRYLESEPDSQLMKRRREAWQWKEQLKTLEDRKAVLTTTPISEPVPEALGLTMEYLKDLQEEDLEIVDPDVIDSLEARRGETGRELADLNTKITELRKRLDDQFTDLRAHKYTLQAVFMHRGSTTYGHYWIYIYDFATHRWREYNDERVQIVEDTNKIFSPDPSAASNKSTPYYLVYVSDDQKDQLVDAVSRDLRAATSASRDRAATGTGSLQRVEEVMDEGVDVSMDDVIDVGSSSHIEHASELTMF